MSRITKYALSDLYEMSSGISSTKEQAGHGAPFVSFSIVFNNYFLPDELPDLMDTNEKEQEIYSIKAGDVLITRTSETIDELAMSCVAVKDYPKATYSGFTKRLRPKKEGIAYPKYMAFYFRSELFRKAVTNNAFMTLRASFNEDIFTFLDVYLPDYEEQVRIGDMLYAVECKIQKNKEINDYLEEMAKTIYDYWFVQFDFPDGNGKPYKSSGGTFKTGLPIGWNYVPIKNICNILSGFSFQSDNYVKNGKYKLLTIKNVQDTGINLDVDNYISILPENMPEYCKLDIGSILMSLTGNVGRVGILYDSNCLLNQRVSLMQAKNPIMAPFIYCLLKSGKMRYILESLAIGTSQKNLSPIEAGNIMIPYDSEIVNDFSKKVTPLIDFIITNLKENNHLTNLRNWLLPILMNGQATIED